MTDYKQLCNTLSISNSTSRWTRFIDKYLPRKSKSNRNNRIKALQEAGYNWQSIYEKLTKEGY